MSDFVHALEKVDGREILAATKLIRNPLAGFSRVVEIEHGSDGIHAKAVDVILVEPEERVGNQIILHFVAAVVVDERAPIGMRALARVGVLVEVAAVKLREAVSVAREMRGSPIENHADAGLVAAVDEFHKFRGRAKAARGRKVAERLVAPGAVIGMLHDGEQFDVGVAEFLNVGDELVAKFAIGEPAIVIFRNAAPRPKMDLVNGDGGLKPVFPGAL